MDSAKIVVSVISKTFKKCSVPKLLNVVHIEIIIIIIIKSIYLEFCEEMYLIVIKINCQDAIILIVLK